MRPTALLLISIFGFALQSNRFHASYELIPPDEPATLGVEDRMGRLAYEAAITQNPATGLVPANIRQKEVAYAQLLDRAKRRFRTQELEVASVGPSNVGGRTRAVAFDVRDEQIILAGGVSGGVWKSTNGGITWVRKSDPENRNSVTCIVQDTRPGREDTWYHGTGEIVGNSARGGSAPFRGNGIYKSTNNGETWTAIPSTLDSDPAIFNSQFQYIWDIEINDRNLLQDEIIVAAFGGILRSLDGGDTWQVELGQQLFNLPDSIDLNAVNASFFTGLEKTVDGVFYASLSTTSTPEGNSPDAGIYISSDGGRWFEITPFTQESAYNRIVMGHAPSNPRICYFLVDSNPTFVLQFNLGRITGQTVTGSWSDPFEVPAFGGQLGDFDSQGSYNMVIKVDPTNPSTVFIGGTNLYRSTDGFQTQENIDWIGGYDPEGGTGVYDNHHPDQHEILFYPSEPSRMLSANDGGLRLSADFNADSVTWENRNQGYLTSQFFTIALSKEPDDVLIGGMQDNGTDITGGSINWAGIIGGDGGYAATTRGKNLWFVSFQSGQTLRLTLNEDFDITSFARVDPAGLVEESGSSYLFINPFALDPVNPNRMLIAGGNRLYINDNVSQIPGGSQVPTSLGWKEVSRTFLSEGGLFSALDFSLDGSVAYAGTSNGRFFRINNVNSPVDIAAQEYLSSVVPEGFVSAISVNPENSDHLLMVLSNYKIPSIFESRDGGRTFQDISGNLEENPDGSGNGPSIRWGEIIPLNDGILYVVGTSVGVYATETAGTDTQWIKQSSGLIGNAVVPMLDYRPLDGRLAIATHGNGVFTTTVDNFKAIEIAPPSNEPIVQTFSYPNPFSASTTIRYSLPQDATVRIDLFSTKGEYINNLLWAPQFAGENSITWDGTNASGVKLANGIYLYRIEYSGRTETGRVQLIN